MLLHDRDLKGSALTLDDMNPDDLKHIHRLAERMTSFIDPLVDWHTETVF